VLHSPQRKTTVKPVGISSYVTKLLESLPPAFEDLPSPKALEAELRRDDIPEGE
jgi:hypothetical protein